MKRRAFHRLMLLGSVAAALPGCDSAAPFRLGLHPWPGYETLTLADHFGWLPKGVELVTGDSASDSMTGLRNGQLSAAALTLDEVIRLRCEGLPLTVVLVFNESVGADQVLMRIGFDPLQTKAPIRVAVERSAVGKVVFSQWQKHLGLPMEAFDLIDLSPADQTAAWDSGALDAAVSYAPYSRYLALKGGNVVFDSRSFPGLVLDVLAVHTDRTGWRDRDRVKGLLKAHFQGRDHLLRNPEDAMRRIATWRELDYQEVMLSYAGINQPDMATNRRLLATGEMVDQAVPTLEPLLRELGLLEATCSFDGLRDPSFLS